MSLRATFVFAGVMVAALVAAIFLDGCNPKTSADVQRATARSAITVSAAALVALDAECARVARASKDISLALKCSTTYDGARASLVGAAVVVDAWANADVRGDVTCAVVHAAAELASLSRELAGKGGKPIPAVDDALELASALGSCPPKDRLELGELVTDGGRE